MSIQTEIVVAWIGLLGIFVTQVVQIYVYIRDRKGKEKALSASTDHESAEATSVHLDNLKKLRDMVDEFIKRDTERQVQVSQLAANLSIAQAEIDRLKALLNSEKALRVEAQQESMRNRKLRLETENELDEERRLRFQIEQKYQEDQIMWQKERNDWRIIVNDMRDEIASLRTEVARLKSIVGENNNGQSNSGSNPDPDASEEPQGDSRANQPSGKHAVGVSS